ncbi:unnamed protein product [Hydatigera taeniaeformis]|uniref:General transcription factor IIF subunit 1 n=1 Tax=Hydatigena taeniaeformis TaxID=6205 RepID=A0A0R3WM69_HYDTA|nr:unnamed protein product [Hydatigera taeniaeformis]
MADSSNKARLDQQQSQQPLLTPQLITVSTATSNFATNGLPVTRPATSVIVRTTTNSPSLTRNLVVIRPSTVAGVAAPSAPRFFVQPGSSRPILPQLETSSSLDVDNQPDASNAPVATLLRNAPITMRFDGHIQPIGAVPVAGRLSAMNRHSVSSGNIAPTGMRLGGVVEVTGAPAQPPNRKIIREMQVRVCTRADRKLSVLRYNAYDRIDLTGAVNNGAGDSKGGPSVLPEVFIQRENNLRQYKASHNIVDVPTRGAGSEFGQEAREEARLRKLGIVRQGYRAEDQPWLLTVGKGRTAKRYRGVKEGSVSANVRHFVFCQTKDGNFDAYPVHEWYKFSPEITYRYLRDDEAEAEFSRRHKTMNLFNVMVKRKMADEAVEEAMAEGNDAFTNRSHSGTKNGKATKRDRSSALLLTELDEWKDFGADDEEEEDEGAEGITTGDVEVERVGDLGEGSEVGFTKKPVESEKKANSKKRRAAAIVARKRRATKQRARRRRKGAIGNSSDEEDDINEEAWDESDPDDHEGDEVKLHNSTVFMVDYMTDSSSDEEKLSEDDREQIYQEQGVDEEAGLKALLTDMSDSEEEQQNKPENSNPDDFDEDGDDVGEDADGKGEHEQKLRSGDSKSRRCKTGFSDSSSNEDDSDDSSDDSSSDSSSSSASDSDVAPDDPARLARKAQTKVELLQRISDRVSTPAPLSQANDQSNSGGTPKRPLEDSGLTSIAAPENPSKRPKLNEPATDDVFIAAVRKYLMRKPISVAELLKKIRSKRLVPHSSQIGRSTGALGTDDVAETMLANALRKLRPLKHIINGQPVLSLKR